MEEKFKKNIITQLSDREHLLKRPGMYIGSIKPETTQSYFYNSETKKFEYTTYEYIPGLVKIIMEILDNSLDEGKRTDYNYANKINVEITDTSVTITDNGRGVPLDVDPGTKLSMAELAFTHPKAGANFDDTDRQTIGLNGVGSFCTNVWSKVFNVDTCDGKRIGQLRCLNNMEQHTFNIIKGDKKKQGTKVYFEPDLQRFGVEVISEVHKSVVYQRLLFLAITYPQIKFMFNGEQLSFKNGKTFIESFNEDNCTIESDNYLISVLPNDSDDFLQVSYINGLDVKKGGNHIDIINAEIVSRLKDKLVKHYKEIRTGDIKNKLQYVVIFKNFKNPEFNSQTKEQLTSSPTDIKRFLNSVDWDKFVQAIYKNDPIIDPIIETYKIKEEMKLRQSLKTVSKRSKDFKSDKYLPAIGKKKFLLICEGNSAAGGCSSAFGRDGKGYYASRGVPINGYISSIQRFTANEEISDIFKILNLQLNGQHQNLEYENIVLANDADCFEENTLIVTKRGNIPLKDVTYDDFVLTHTGQWKQIINIIERKNKIVLK